MYMPLSCQASYSVDGEKSLLATARIDRDSLVFSCGDGNPSSRLLLAYELNSLECLHTPKDVRNILVNVLPISTFYFTQLLRQKKGASLVHAHTCWAKVDSNPFQDK